MLISKIFSRPVNVGYEGDDGADDAAAKAAADKAAADAAKKVGKTFTQEDVDRIVQDRLAKATKSAHAEKQKLIDQLQQVQEGAGTTAAQKEALEAQIEELRVSMLSSTEQERRKQEKLDKDWQTKHDAAVQTSKGWQDRHNSLLIGHEISRASIAHKVLPNSVEFVDAKLRPIARLVEKLGDDGKPNGDYEAKVKIQSPNKEGKLVELDLTIDEAIKTLKDQPEKYGNLFEGNNAGGLGGGAGQPGKKTDVRTMVDNPAEYMRLRKSDPASVGLAPTT